MKIITFFSIQNKQKYMVRHTNESQQFNKWNAHSQILVFWMLVVACCNRCEMRVTGKRSKTLKMHNETHKHIIQMKFFFNLPLSMLLYEIFMNDPLFFHLFLSFRVCIHFIIIIVSFSSCQAARFTACLTACYCRPSIL